jgi:heptosyltransferase III
MQRRNVLIFHAGALGDFVLSWPLAAALGRIFAQSRIIYVTHGQKGALAERVLRLESDDIENGWHRLQAENPEVPEKLTGILKNTHAIYTFLQPTDLWLQNVRRINPDAKVICVDPLPNAEFTGHAADWLLEQLRDHPVERAATEQMLRSISDRGIGLRRGVGNDVVMHPGSGSEKKCWPIENFLALAEELRRSGRNVRMVVGEVERERWPRAILSSLGPVLTPKAYLELLDELSTAGAFVGNDSGPGQLAGIIGVPTVSIFTATDPRRWRPLGPKVRALSGDVSVEQAAAAVREVSV